MKPEDIFKKALKTPPPKGNEDDIAPPIQISFLKEGEVVGELEFSNQDFLNTIAKQAGIKNFTEANLILDDGIKSYTFTLDVDEFVKNKIEIGKPMK